MRVSSHLIMYTMNQLITEDGEEIMLTNKAMLEILGLVEEEECGGGRTSPTSFTAPDCREPG